MCRNYPNPLTIYYRGIAESSGQQFHAGFSSVYEWACLTRNTPEAVEYVDDVHRPVIDALSVSEIGNVRATRYVLPVDGVIVPSIKSFFWQLLEDTLSEPKAASLYRAAAMLASVYPRVCIDQWTPGARS